MNVAARLETHAPSPDGNSGTAARGRARMVTVTSTPVDLSAATYQEFVLPARSSGRNGPARQAVEAACAKVVSSRTFRHSARHRAFLRHVVKAVLDGRETSLKEVAIGRDVFGLSLNGYDPARDSNVRVEARRLRLKLQRYYADEGRDDALEICLPVGTYAPTFEARQSGAQPGSRSSGGEPLLLVMPFVQCGDGPAPSTSGVALADQLIDLFGSQPGMRIVAPMVASKMRERAVPFDTLRGVHAIDYVIDGSIVSCGARMRCVAHLSRTRDGVRLWSCRFDTARSGAGGPDAQKTVDEDPFAFQDRIASQVFAAVSRECATP